MRHYANTPEAEQTVPVLTAQARQEAITRLEPDLTALLRRGVPADTLAEMVDIWLSGLVSQLADTPADIEIERHIWQEYPELRSYQRASLEHQVANLNRVLSPAVQTITPRSIWLPSAAMNYALTKPVARMLNEPWMLRPYRNGEAAALGEELLTLVPGKLPDTVPALREISDAWAQHLQLRHLPTWLPFDRLPRNSRVALE